jgi:prepilin-type N-terminal cleavage/methylation domain-containing protein
MSRFTKSNKNKGFTLIELLVVIAIIGLLSSVVLASVNSAREKAAIAKTLAEMKSLQNAIEMYRNDTGMVPLRNDNNGVLEIEYFNSDNLSYGRLENLVFNDENTTLSSTLVPEYISKIPSATDYGGIGDDGDFNYRLGYLSYGRDLVESL